MVEHTDEWIIEEIVVELKEAQRLNRTPLVFVGGREEEERLKRLLPIARERLNKSGVER